MRSSSLPPLVGRSAVGKDAQVTIIRNRSRKKIKVRIAELPDSMTRASFTPRDDDKPIEKSALGMNVIELSESARKKLRVKSGVEVTEVDDTGSARDAGILKGDVITMIDNLAVDSVDDFDSITDDLKAGKSVALLVQRRSGPVFLAIRPEDT